MAQVTLAYEYEGFAPDTTIEVDDATAKRLIRDGMARYGVSAPTTVADVLAEVGHDAGKAATALAREQATASPRSTLVAELQKIIGPADD